MLVPAGDAQKLERDHRSAGVRDVHTPAGPHSYWNHGGVAPVTGDLEWNDPGSF